MNMIENLPNPEPQNTQQYAALVDVMTRVGYKFEMETTHVDPEGHLHFNKPIGDKFYPHFHAIYKPSRNKFNLHIDIRTHKTRTESIELSDELQRLQGHFTLLSQSTNLEISSISLDLKKKIIDQAFFKVSRALNARTKNSERHITRARIQKKSKLAHESKHKYRESKYSQDSDLKTWYISDCEPLNINWHDEADRQEDK